MKLPSTDIFKKVPVYLIVLIILAILVFNALILPEYRNLANAKNELDRELTLSKNYLSKLEQIKMLPAFNIELDSRDELLLSITEIARNNGYQITDVSYKDDVVGGYIAFGIDINNYKSIANIVGFLENLRTVLPVTYTDYNMTNRHVKVGGRCYYR